MSFLSFLKKAFNPMTGFNMIGNINKGIKDQGIKGLLNPLSPFKAVASGVGRMVNSENDPNPWSVTRDVNQGIMNRGVKGMLNPLASFQGLNDLGKSMTGGGGPSQGGQPQAAASGWPSLEAGQPGGQEAQALQSMFGNASGGRGGFNPGAGFNPGGFAGGVSAGPRSLGGQPPMQQGAPQAAPKPQQPMDSNARFKLWRDQGIR
jgi:hypothetical protein